MRLSPRKAFGRRVLGTERLPLWLRDGWRIEAVVPETDRFLVQARGDQARFTLEARQASSGGLALKLVPGSAKGPRKALATGLERVATAVRAGQHRAGPELFLRPFQAVFLLTDICNLRCSYCQVPFGQNVLSEAQIDRALELVADEASPSFTLLGGEPTLAWDRVRYLVETTRARWPDCSLCMVTNATQFTPERAAWLASLDLDLTVSLDGDRDSHVRWRRGTSNDTEARAAELYEQTLDGLRLLVEAGQRVQANMVVTPETVHALAANAELLYELGCDTVSVSPAVGVRWPDEALDELARGFSAWSDALLDRLDTADADRRQRTRVAIHWELRRAWYSLGEGIFHPFARRVVFGADGKLYSDLYNSEIGGELVLGDLATTDSLADLPEGRTTTPQASYVAASWTPQVFEDVKRISTVQLEALRALDAAFDTRFDQPVEGARELVGHAPFDGWTP